MTVIASPRSFGRILLGVILIGVFLSLACAPFLFPGTRALDTAARICVFIAFVASYDLLLGYAGIVSFAHTIFFGFGAYGVAITSAQMGRSFEALGLGAVLGVMGAVALAAVIGLFSLRVRAIFFAMITLAVASAAAVLVSQMSALTGGEDGLTFQIPKGLTSAAIYASEPVFGVRLTGKIANYYVIFAVSLGLIALMLRIVNAPFGRVLQAIRENEFRAEAIGYRVVGYRVAVTCLSAAFAAMAGALYAIWLRYVGPDTVLSFGIMIDVLIMTVIGGMGTIYGAVIGTVLFMLARSYLQDVMGSLGAVVPDYPVLAALLNPDRWQLWIGVLFVLSIYFFPNGIVGRLRGGGPKPR
ncbi:branched-chain amino acid ABC transporter permease [Pseudoruegeria sp. SK021]|uniref:branched-chain amino acid ABC transporter permease n=1 Tax=Pseudoruegeria sp. SK021 TaxID=1933035 RepID=UPI000A225F37|nr:branched-chain amino acid ABC transporter permease [Pseudoruegeria sp. SK021]OSP55285.1 branched-chain amino acid ABC transporter permease [Pseudoruegeria sp. SK021]